MSPPNNLVPLQGRFCVLLPLYFVRSPPPDDCHKDPGSRLHHCNLPGKASNTGKRTQRVVADKRTNFYLADTALCDASSRVREAALWWKGQAGVVAEPTSSRDLRGSREFSHGRKAIVLW